MKYIKYIPYLIPIVKFLIAYTNENKIYALYSSNELVALSFNKEKLVKLMTGDHSKIEEEIII